MKYSQLVGVAAAILFVASAWMNWTWYPDLQKYFTGFFSENNNYGKPGKVFMFFSAIAIVFFLVPRIWAKRWNMLFCGLALAFAFKTFIVFTSCYRGICPEKQTGIWVMLFSAVLMMLASLLPDLNISKDQPANNKATP